MLFPKWKWSPVLLPPWHWLPHLPPPAFSLFGSTVIHNLQLINQGTPCMIHPHSGVHSWLICSYLILKYVFTLFFYFSFWHKYLDWCLLVLDLLSVYPIQNINRDILIFYHPMMSATSRATSQTMIPLFTWKQQGNPRCSSHSLEPYLVLMLTHSLNCLPSLQCLCLFKIKITSCLHLAYLSHSTAHLYLGV